MPFELLPHTADIRIKATGAPIDAFDGDVKAVTYHDLAITETPEGYVTIITLDI